MSAADGLLDVVARNRAGETVGVTSVCSAHPLVIRATVRQAAAEGTLALVEATSNQVDQFGGYTGMTPAGFRDLVLREARRWGLPLDRVVLGGDHLGPNPWRDRSADEAMAAAEAMVEAYVGAGFGKLHLDCSMACADDPDVLDDGVVAERAARLAAVAERAPGGGELFFVVGTEVPAPGGARERLERVVPTDPAAARATLAAHRAAFAAAGIEDAWPRVVALVVQPGVEFDALGVVDFEPALAEGLSGVAVQEPHIVFEAHSTDYQREDCLEALVARHFAILKVGPALTFALREALFALARLEHELVGAAECSGLEEVLERRMLAEPRWWRDHYGGDEREQRLARRFSYSDRMRYYWADPEVGAAQGRLLANLGARELPLPVISQLLPDQYRRVRAGELALEPEALVVDRVADVLRAYAGACRP